MNDTISLIITDDAPYFHERVPPILLKAGFTILGIAKNGHDLLEILKDKRPDVLLLDLNMPVLDGNKAMNEIRKLYPELNVIIVSAHFEYTLIEDFIQRGAKAYISKDEALSEPDLLINLIQSVMENKRFHLPNPDIKLSKQQKYIIGLLCDGKTITEIAEELEITRSAVNQQKQTLFEIFEVNTTAELIKVVSRRGLDYVGRKR